MVHERPNLNSNRRPDNRKSSAEDLNSNRGALSNNPDSPGFP
ncbi:MAG: hypothetical protein AABW61_01035 [Candidatus Aenigmatarchaeota archaeon]